MNSFEPNNNANFNNDLSLSPQFLSGSHTELFYTVLSRLSPAQQSARDYLAAAFIISSNDELYAKMSPYFSSDGFKSIELFNNEDLSSGHTKLAKAAANLFGQNYEIDLAELVVSLDHSLFHTLLQALIIRKYGVDLR